MTISKPFVLVVSLALSSLSGCAPPPVAAQGSVSARAACCAFPPFDLYFSYGAATLNERSRRAVQRAAVTANGGPDTLRAQVTGFGAGEAQEALAAERVERVVAALVAEGVTRGRIDTRNASPPLPANQDGPDNREPQNRRVDIYIH